LIVDREGAPAAALPNEEFASKDSSCSPATLNAASPGRRFLPELDIAGLDELMRAPAQAR
jgi:hypothetical protein